MTADVLERPEGISDIRWASIQNTVAGGHLPWCEEHIDDADGVGWCKSVIKSFACEVELHNGTTDGAVKIALYPRDDVDLDSLTIPEAVAVASVLDQAARRARMAHSGQVAE